MPRFWFTTGDWRQGRLIDPMNLSRYFIYRTPRAVGVVSSVQRWWNIHPTTCRSGFKVYSKMSKALLARDRRMSHLQ